MSKQKDFNSFLSNIEPSKTTVEYISSVQTNLRKYLKNHESYKDVHIDTFLSGSYAKHTSIRPVLGDKKRDVDIIVVTSYDSSNNSLTVLKELRDVLLEKKEYKSAVLQHHSVGIEMNGISIDVVPVIEDENDETLYYIGDKETGEWTITDPKGHKSWSTDVNQQNNGCYKPLVKIFKWWHRFNCPENKKYPKGITLEKIVADNLGDYTQSTECYLIETMQNIVSTYKEDYVDKSINPVIEDPSEKIEDNDLLTGYSIDDFSSFIFKIQEHLELLDEEGVSNETWRKILGNDFPKDTTQNNYLALHHKQICETARHKQLPTWPMQRGGAVFISAKVIDNLGNELDYVNNSSPLPKECSIVFKALTGVKEPYTVYWQVVNTGVEAAQACCLRGNFELSNHGNHGKKEYTLYTGTHSVQCFVVKKGICMAKSKPFIINIQ